MIKQDKYRGSAAVEFQLTDRYVAVVDYEAYFNGKGTEVEMYCEVDMVDLETEEVFELSQLLPNLRHELEYEVEKQTKTYIETHYEELVQDLLDAEQLMELDANVADDEPYRKGGLND